MNLFQRRKILKETNTLDLVPVRTRGHEVEEERVVILIPKFNSRIYHLISPRLKELYFRIKLDELGSLTWNSIDDHRSVRDISDIIRKRDGMDDNPADETDDRLSKFMTMLYERRYITFRQLMEGE